MDSINFEMLRTNWPELASLGGFAEHYVHSDAPSALIKLRTYAEQMVAGIYQSHDLPLPYQNNLFDLLTEESFKQSVPKVVLDKLHQIRLDGNKAAHGQGADSRTALLCLRESWSLGCWYVVTYGHGKADELPPYQEPCPEDIKAKLKKEKKAALQRLADQEAQLQELLLQVDALRAQAATFEKTEAELNAYKSAGQAVADVLKFDEVTTRKRLIDKQLLVVGWNIDPNGGSTTDVSVEEAVPYQPTQTGIGYADYVLWDDTGKPLAVIEAKKSAVSSEKGAHASKALRRWIGEKVWSTSGHLLYQWLRHNYLGRCTRVSP